MALHISRGERLNNYYRKVEALYRRGCSLEEIAMTFGLSMMDVLDITQKIYALDQIKMEREFK